MSNVEYRNEFACLAYDTTYKFWQTFELPIARTWIDACSTGIRLAANLIEEEYKELINAKDNLAELDAFCDLLYVTAGAMHALGYGRYLVFSRPESEAFAGTVSEIIGLLRAPGVLCHRRLEVAIPEAIHFIITAGTKRYPKLRAAYQAVHANNMSKLWCFKPPDDKTLTVKPKGDKFLVRRVADGKVLKPADFKPVDLAAFL